MTEVKTYSYGMTVEIDLDVEQITDLAKRLDNIDRKDLVEVLVASLDEHDRQDAVDQLVGNSEYGKTLDELREFLRRSDLGIESRDGVTIIRESLRAVSVYA